MPLLLQTDEVADMRRRRALLFTLALLAAAGFVIEGVFAQIVLVLVAVAAITSIVNLTADLRQHDLDNEVQRTSDPPRSGRAPP